jgi:hypothetical protein
VDNEPIGVNAGEPFVLDLIYTPSFLEFEILVNGADIMYSLLDSGLRSLNLAQVTVAGDVEMFFFGFVVPGIEALAV